MPFLHEDNHGSVTITPTNGTGGTDLLHRFRQEKFGSKSFSGNSSGAKLHKIIRNSTPSLADVQRKVAHKKLQMAKLMGHGGMAAPSVDFRKHQGHMMSDYHNDPLQVASRRARSNNFTLNETFALLKIWQSDQMQWQMKHNFRNFRVWEAISYAMQELGHDRTAIQCKNRIQNLTSIFYRIKKSKQDYRTFNFPYYKIIGDVLDGKKNGNNNSMPPNMAEFIQHFTNASGVTVSPTQQSGSGSTGGMAAHMALVEEYQHLINGNPEVTLTPTGERSSSSNGTSGMNVLSPEVSISEGDSPIRMDSQTSRSNSQTTSSASLKNHLGSNSNNFSNRNASMNGVSGNSVKDDPDNGVLEDGSIPSENDHEASDMDDGNMYGAEEEAIAMLSRVENYSGGKMKRPFPSGFGGFGKSGNGIPGKRPRGLSSATTASTSVLDDPVSQYLSEMVDIERQWLDMERERASNERQMMEYMMQILQVLVCPSQEEEQEDQVQNEDDNEAEAESEYAENENEENENDEENEIRQMIEENE